MKKVTATFTAPDYVDKQTVHDYVNHMIAANTTADITITPIVKTYEWDNLLNNRDYFSFWDIEAASEQNAAEKIFVNTATFQGTMTVKGHGLDLFQVFQGPGGVVIVREKQEQGF